MTATAITTPVQNKIPSHHDKCQNVVPIPTKLRVQFSQKNQKYLPVSLVPESKFHLGTVVRKLFNNIHTTSAGRVKQKHAVAMVSGTSSDVNGKKACRISRSMAMS